MKLILAIVQLVKIIESWESYNSWQFMKSFPRPGNRCCTPPCLQHTTSLQLMKILWFCNLYQNFMSRGNWKMRKMVSVPKLIIVMKPNLSAPLLLLSTGPPFYIILENIIELLQVPAWQCSHDTFVTGSNYYYHLFNFWDEKTLPLSKNIISNMFTMFLLYIHLV